MNLKWIGLAISNEIVKLHKGKINIRKSKGEGTCITFTLKNNLMDAIWRKNVI
ncbi:MAG: ATP-binding protein [Intestinibacter sp.]